MLRSCASSWRHTRAMVLNADAVCLRDQGQRLTGHAPLVGFGFLECREDWRPSELHASGHCALAAFAGSFSNQRPLEFSETAEDGEHEAAVGVVLSAKGSRKLLKNAPARRSRAGR